jgi:hypothetical protein
MTGGSTVTTWVGSFYGTRLFYGTLCNWTRRGRLDKQTDGGRRGASDAMGCNQPMRVVSFMIPA